MNYRGSYRKLLGNSKAALLAAIEVYNKPSFLYRDECAVILLLNAWELFLKSILSKNDISVFYPKRRGQPYKTLTWQDAFTKARTKFPASVAFLPVQRNLELLGIYRDNSVHFYNAKGFEVVVYSLAQTSIKNFRDLLESTFGQRLEDEVNWKLLPLGMEPPLDVVDYISGATGAKKSSAVKQYLAELADAVAETKDAGADAGRLLTIFDVKLESVKKIGDADVVVGVDSKAGVSGPLVVTRTQDPNKSHPLRQKDILEKIQSLHGQPFTSYVFQALVWKHDLKSKPQYCWQASEGVLTKYSNDILPFLRKLSSADLGAAMADYRNHMKSKSKKAVA